MIKEQKKAVSVIIPTRNSETTPGLVLKSVEKQDYPISKVYILDNNSSDSTALIAKDYKQKSRFSIEVIVHKKDMGLSYSYNEALSKVKTSLVITLQSDSVIVSRNGISALTKPFLKDGKIVAPCSMRFKVRGLAGIKSLRQEVKNDTMGDDLTSSIRLQPRAFWFVIASLSQTIAYYFPRLAFELSNAKYKK